MSKQNQKIFLTIQRPFAFHRAQTPFSVHDVNVKKKWFSYYKTLSFFVIQQKLFPFFHFPFP